MKVDSDNKKESNDFELENVADLIRSGVRGKYAARYREEVTIVITPELDPDDDETHPVV